MVGRRYSIPSTAALVAFESAARHLNFSRAAEELNTSQSAISRHIAGLEGRLNTSLFERRRKKLILTPQGAYFQQAVVAALDNLQVAGNAIAGLSQRQHLTIACSHEVSHLFVMPRFEALQAAVGADIQIRIMTYEYDAMDTSLDPRVDLIFSYDTSWAAPSERAVACEEAVRPVCAPAFAAANREILEQPVAAWAALPFLQLSKENKGWATWQDWFTAMGAPETTPDYLPFGNYVYLLEAAAAGRGLALAWRGQVERYLEMGALVPVSDDYVAFDHSLHVLLTPRGSDHPAARASLAFFACQDRQ